VKRVFIVSAILIHCTLQTTSPFTVVVINEAPWLCAPLQNDRLIIGVELPALVDSFLQPQIA